MDHVLEIDKPFDLTDGETIAEVNGAVRALGAMMQGAALLDGYTNISEGMGEGGASDIATAVLGLLSGDLEPDATTYVLELLKIAANKLIDSDPNLQHMF